MRAQAAFVVSLFAMRRRAGDLATTLAMDEGAPEGFAPFASQQLSVLRGLLIDGSRGQLAPDHNFDALKYAVWLTNVVRLLAPDAGAARALQAAGLVPLLIRQLSFGSSPSTEQGPPSPASVMYNGALNTIAGVSALALAVLHVPGESDAADAAAADPKTLGAVAALLNLDRTWGCVAASAYLTALVLNGQSFRPAVVQALVSSLTLGSGAAAAGGGGKGEKGGGGAVEREGPGRRAASSVLAALGARSAAALGEAVGPLMRLLADDADDLGAALAGERFNIILSRGA